MSTCPLCRNASSRWATLRGYEIEECSVCQHRFVAQPLSTTHIDDVYGDDYFHGGGAGYTNYLSQQELLQARGKHFAELVTKQTALHGTVLDVGAAAGFLLSGWQQAGWSGLGVEPNRSMCDEAAKRGVDVRCGSFEDFMPATKASELGTIQCVSMIQVLSHFIRPREALEKAYSLLAPGGVLLIETWNRNSLTARMSGQGWHEYSPPSVIQWFTPDGLTKATVEIGFELVRTQRSTRLINVGHAKSLLHHAAEKSTLYWMASLFARILPNRLNLPYPGDDLFWAIYRKPF